MSAPDTRIDEIQDGIYRISTFVPDIAPPAGFTFNEFFVDAEEPLLFHTGPRQLFPLVVEAISTLRPPSELRWITFSHVESDECGSMNQWLELAPRAEVAANEMACMVSLNDLADRAPRVLADGEVLDLGGKRMRLLATPHVPHNWEAQLFYEETTNTLLSGDLFTHVGNDEPLTDADVVEPAIHANEAFQHFSLSADTGATLRRLAGLEPNTLAVMHGSSYEGDCGAALRDLADYYDKQVLDVVHAGIEVKPLWPGCPDLAAAG